MMASNHLKLQNMLIRSYAHLRSLEFKAYFKATKDLHFDDLPSDYSNHSMTRMQGRGEYLNLSECREVLEEALYAINYVRESSATMFLAR